MAETVAARYEHPLHKKIDRTAERQVFRSHRIATEYYCVWHTKNRLTRGELPDFYLEGVTPDKSLRQRDLEVLESKGMSAIVSASDEDSDRAKTRGVDLTNLFMVIETQKMIHAMRDIRWQLILSPDDSFVAPMSPPESLMIPLSHSMLLIGVKSGEKHSPEKVVDEEKIDALNCELAKGEDRWFVGRTLQRVTRVADSMK